MKQLFAAIILLSLVSSVGAQTPVFDHICFGKVYLKQDSQGQVNTGHIRLSGGSVNLGTSVVVFQPEYGWFVSSQPTQVHIVYHGGVYHSAIFFPLVKANTRFAPPQPRVIQAMPMASTIPYTAKRPKTENATVTAYNGPQSTTATNVPAVIIYGP